MKASTGLAGVFAALFSTTYALPNDLILDACIVACMSNDPCHQNDSACICSRFEAVFSSAVGKCIVERCPQLNVDTAVGKAKQQCMAGSAPAASTAAASAESPTLRVAAAPSVTSADTAATASLYPQTPASKTHATLVLAASSQAAESPAASSSSTAGAFQKLYSSLDLSSETHPTTNALSMPTSVAGLGDPTSKTPSHGGSDGNLSTAAKAGIGIGAAIAGMGLVGALVVFIWKRRQTQRRWHKTDEGEPIYFRQPDEKSGMYGRSTASKGHGLKYPKRTHMRPSGPVFELDGMGPGMPAPQYTPEYVPPRPQRPEVELSKVRWADPVELESPVLPSSNSDFNGVSYAIESPGSSLYESRVW